MFELNPDEIILKPQRRKGVRGFDITHIVRKPTDEDWFQWDFHRLPRTVTRTNNMDVQGQEAIAYQKVYDRIAIRVDGTLGGKPVGVGENWRDEIPTIEKRRVVRTFSQVQPVEISDQDQEDLNEFAPNEARYFVKLMAGLGVDLFYVFYGFRGVSAEQIKDYESRSQIWKTKFEGSKVLMERHLTLKPLASLCRDLVICTFGYTWDGRDLVDVEEWKAKLDALHCMVAVQQLFADVQEEFEANFPTSEAFASLRSKAEERKMQSMRDTSSAHSGSGK